MDDLRDLALLLFVGAVGLALGVLIWLGIRAPVTYTPERTTVTVCCPAGVGGAGGGPTTTTTRGTR